MRMKAWVLVATVVFAVFAPESIRSGRAQSVLGGSIPQPPIISVGATRILCALGPARYRVRVRGYFFYNPDHHSGEVGGVFDRRHVSIADRLVPQNSGGLYTIILFNWPFVEGKLRIFRGQLLCGRNRKLDDLQVYRITKA
jgi:hypothetical protein